MKVQTLKPFIWLGSLILIISLACGTPAATTVAPPPVEKTEEVSVVNTPEPVVTEEPTNGAVNTLSDVKSATIEIIAEGSWQEPEGWNINVGYRGSGFIIDPSGIAVTNNHVVTGAALLKVYIGGDDRAYNARVLGVSECSDLAVIDIEGDGFPYLEWYDGQITVGTKVFASGFPEGNYTLTDGIVSVEEAPGESYWSSVDYVIQHTAKIIPGNSGGPLVTEDGKVVGVNYAGIQESDTNYTISRDEALSVIQQLQDGKDVDSIGVNGITVSGEVGGYNISGVWVRSVESGSPADKALIESGDIIYQMEGEVLATDGTMADYCDVLRSRNPSDTMDVTVIRYSDLSLMEGQLNGREMEVTGYFYGDTDTETPTDPVETGYMTVTDDTYTIQLDVPSEWTDMDNSVWYSDWGAIDFEAPSVWASTDLDLYNDFAAPGVFFAASKDMGKIGGFVELLDGVDSWYLDYCDKDLDYWHADYGEGDWYDPLYEGKFNIWTNCDSGGYDTFILAARPKDDPLAYLMLVEVKYYTDIDMDALFQILATFEVVGDF